MLMFVISLAYIRTVFNDMRCIKVVKLIEVVTVKIHVILY